MAQRLLRLTICLKYVKLWWVKWLFLRRMLWSLWKSETCGSLSCLGFVIFWHSFTYYYLSCLIKKSLQLFILFQPEYTYVDGDGTVPAESAAVSFFLVHLWVLGFPKANLLLVLLSLLWTLRKPSLQAAQFKAIASVGVSGSHRGLLRDKRVFELIQQWLGVEPKKAKRKHLRTHKVVDSGWIQSLVDLLKILVWIIWKWRTPYYGVIVILICYCTL